MSLMDKLASERRARLAAERMLAVKSRELFDANRKLAVQARALSVKVAEQEVDLKAERGKAEEFRHTATRAEEGLRAADESRRAAETLMATTQERFGNAIEAITDGIALFDAADVLVTGNAAWFALFDDLSDISPGVTYTEILKLGAEEGIFDVGNMGAHGWIASMLDRWDANPIPDITLRLWNGCHYQLSDRRVANGDKISLLVDVTERIAREEELEVAKNRAEGAARAKAAFLANMSHELRTPMNGVVGMADMLSESRLDSEQKLYVDTIRSSGSALLGIINDVLDFSKLEAGKMGLAPAAFDLERLIHEVLILMQPTAHEKGLDLAFDYDIFLPTRLIGDAGRLRQVLTNLIGNAIKFTDRGHVLIRVVGIQHEAEGTVQLHVAVEDTGIGIPADHIETIFGEFTQVQNERNRAYDGSGLGLSITRELVELMGGDIWVQSEEGQGSNFGFRLNLPLDGAAVAAPDPISPVLRRVALVHSSRLEADVLRRQLEQLQCQVDVFRSGSDVIRGGLASNTDLIVVDERLQDTDGVTLMSTLAETGQSLPAILMSAHPDRIADGPQGDLFEGFLERPIRREALIAELARVAAGLTPRAVQEEEAVVEEEEQENAESAPVLFRPKPRPGRTAPPAIAPPEATTTPDASMDVQPGDDPAVPIAAPQVDPQDGRATAAPHATPGGFRSLRRPAAPAPASVPAPPPQQPPRGRMRILAAEDNRTNQLVFRKMLKDLDIDLRVVENGRVAVEQFESFHPHLVFMDISMPLLDGKQATRQIRWLEAEGLDKPADCPRHVPVVAMTAHAMAGDEEEILGAGLDRYMTKPLRKGDLLAEIVAACPESCTPPQAASAIDAA